MAIWVERSRERLSYVAEYRGDFADTVFVTANIHRDDNEVFQVLRPGARPSKFRSRGWGCARTPASAQA